MTNQVAQESAGREEPIFSLPKVRSRWWELMMFKPQQDGVVVYSDRVIQDSPTRNFPQVIPADDIIEVWISRSGRRYDVHLKVQLLQVLGDVGKVGRKHVIRNLTSDDAEALATAIKGISKNVLP